MNLAALVSDIRNYPGVTRKRTISDVIDFFPVLPADNIIASYGEDAAAIAYNDDVLLLAADGIMESLMRTNPYCAGYYAVLVNINDISAMGGIPLAMVDIVSMKDEKVCAQVMTGVEEAVSKFGVPIVGGHTHPDCAYDAIDIAILGIARKDEVICSHTAKAGDDIILAMDLDGFFPSALPYAWDTTSRKGSDICRRQVLVMNEIGKKHLVHSGKDISNPGSLGTLGMLLETSGKGGEVELEKIPTPSGVDFSQWLKAYQGCGFVVTNPPANSSEVIEMFEQVDMSAAVVGKVNDSRKLVLRQGNESATLFDFTSDKITGCDPSKVPLSGSLRQKVSKSVKKRC
ncbi:MAG: methanogenesis marker 2 protein [Euryarchaeota archaeon]|nr:methanogenesis marker 2 protein [Euryarchaeota archaeon]